MAKKPIQYPTKVEIAADTLVGFFSEKMGIPTTRREAIDGTKRWVRMFRGKADLLEEYHELWTALAKAICEEDGA